MTIFKSFSKVYLINKNILDGLELSQVVYNYIINSKYKFVSLCPNLNCNVIDIFVDRLVLSNAMFEEDFNKVRKSFKAVFDDLSIEDYKVLHKFRLFLEKEIVETGSGKYRKIGTDNVEQKVLDRDSTETATCSIIAMMGIITLEGGILYRYTEVRNLKLNIGSDLDALVGKSDKVKKKLLYYDNIVNLAFEACPESIGVKVSENQKIEMGNAILGKSDNVACSVFNSYYIYLLDLFMGLTNADVRRVIENSITEDSLKLNIPLALNNTDFNTSLLHRFIAKDEMFDAFYDRTVLLPGSGVEIRYPENEYRNSKVLACECDDEIFGRQIFIFITDVDAHFYSCKTVFLDLRVGSFDTLHDVVQPIFDIYGIRDKLNGAVEFTQLTFQPESRGTTKVMVRDEKKTELGDIKYEVYQPTYWRYKGRNNGQSNTAQQSSAVMGQILKNIKPFPRNLAQGQQRGKQADELAKKLCIRLKEGTTLVSEFERKQNIRLDMQGLTS